MYFYTSIDTPPLTTDASPVVSSLKVSKGVLEFIDVGFPLWNARLGKCRIFYNTIQILPFNRNEWFSGENTTLRIPLNMIVDDDPCMIQINCINDDDTYPHELSFGVSMIYSDLQNQSALAGFQALAQVDESEQA